MLETGFFLAKSHLDFAQESIVHIDDAPPLYAVRINIEAREATAPVSPALTATREPFSDIRREGFRLFSREITAGVAP